MRADKSRSRDVNPGDIGARGTLYVLMIVVAVLWGAPLLWMIVTSIKPESEIYAYPPRWWPDALTFEAYGALFQRFPMLDWFSNSTIVAVITTLLTLAVNAAVDAAVFANGQYRNAISKTGGRFCLIAARSGRSSR